MNDAAPTELDLRGLLCPLPVIRTADCVAGLQPGDRLVARCTDPGVREDLPTWCRMHGHLLESLDDQGAEIRILIRVGGAPGSDSRAR